MRILLSFIFFLAISFVASAQIIDNRLGNVFEDEMYYNQEFLWQNKIKSITGVVSIKRPNRPIEPRPDLFVYRFNSVGLLEQLDKVTSVLHLVDTTTIEYKRNDLGEVEIRTEKGNKGFYTKKFVYDKEGRVERLDFGKAENISTEKNTLLPGQWITINSESFKYVVLGAQSVQKSCYNNYGLLYSNITTTRNELGYLISEREEIVMSNRVTVKNYKYNDRGWLEEISWTDETGAVTKTYKFHYDPLGNLLKMEKFKGSTLQVEIEVLYTETMLIEALLHHDLQSHDIVITKFSYEFHQ
jgi:hypothetical protein